MNVVEKSKLRSENDAISLKDRITATIDYGFNWYGMMQAQEFVTRRLGRVLNDQHYLLRNIRVPGIDEGQPFMVLVSPQGVRLLYAYPNRGVFRAKDDAWLRFDTRSRKFKRTQPNLQTVALNLLRQLRQLLEVQGHEKFNSEAVLILTHPRTLVDSARPIVRVVSADAIEYFAANIEQSETSINPDRIHAIVDALLYPQIPEPELAAELLAEIGAEKTTPTFDYGDSAPESRSSERDETLEQIERFFRDDVQPGPSTTVDTAADLEPGIEQTPAFYPDSLEEYQGEQFDQYQEPSSYREGYSLTEEDRPLSSEPYTPTEDPYASPNPFAPTQDAYPPPDPIAPAKSYVPTQQAKPKRKRRRISAWQWLLLGILGIVEFGILLYFTYVILLDLGFL